MAHKLNGIRFGPLEHCTHICVDMQRMFAEPTPWQTPWIKRVLPNILNLVSAYPAATVFTRFIPPSAPEHGSGTWRRYYERWPQMTLSHLGMEMTELMPELSGFIPPARLVDKAVYSPWFGGTLTDTLSERSTNTLVVSGGETDVCVLATVLGAVDHGYRVVIASDALCSSSDETHDALMTLYESRFSEQIEVATSGDILSSWQED